MHRYLRLGLVCALVGQGACLKDGTSTKTEPPMDTSPPTVTKPAVPDVVDTPTTTVDTSNDTVRGSDTPSPAAQQRRYAARECDECEDRYASTCLVRTEDDGRQTNLGCGRASASGRYAMLCGESGNADDGSWTLDVTYYGPDGLLSTEPKRCTEANDFYCEGPGRFLALDDGRFIHRMGNAGDGTNSQAVIDMVTNDAIELPEGEYGLVPHPDGTLAGFLSMVPNIYDKDDKPLVRMTMGCFDARARSVHVVWTTTIAEDDSTPYLLAEIRWEGRTLVMHGDEGDELGRATCPAKPAGA